MKLSYAPCRDMIDTENVDFLAPPRPPIIDVNSLLLPRVASVMFSPSASRTILLTAAERNETNQNEKASMDKVDDKMTMS